MVCVFTLNGKVFQHPILSSNTADALLIIASSSD